MLGSYDNPILIKGNVCVRCPDETIALTIIKFDTNAVEVQKVPKPSNSEVYKSFKNKATIPSPFWNSADTPIAHSAPPLWSNALPTKSDHTTEAVEVAQTILSRASRRDKNDFRKRSP
ncbi:hypothetical protein AVEN_214868-1, partial [Araneus ventricosus]